MDGLVAPTRFGVIERLIRDDERGVAHVATMPGLSRSKKLPINARLLRGHLQV